MNNSLKEKLSLLSELIQLANADHELRTEEFEFLYAIAKQLGVNDKDFERIFEENIAFTPQKKRTGSYRSIPTLGIDDERRPNGIR